MKVRSTKVYCAWKSHLQLQDVFRELQKTSDSKLCPSIHPETSCKLKVTRLFIGDFRRGLRVCRTIFFKWKECCGY